MAVDYVLHHHNHMPRPPVGNDVTTQSSVESTISLIQLPRYTCLGMPVLCSGTTTSRQAQTTEMEATVM